jgi:aspartyl-tRNA(Asn)/glutamyl-tRNA(Gln) amidotransferase subunit C
MHLSDDEVRHVAELAKLQLSDDEVALYGRQLSAILDYADQLGQVDTSHVPPTPYVLPLENVLRDDVARPSLPVEEALANAPAQANGFFRVRAVFDEGAGSGAASDRAGSDRAGSDSAARDSAASEGAEGTADA